MQKWMRGCLEKNIPSLHDIEGIFMNSQQLCISVPALSKPGSVNTSSWLQEVHEARLLPEGLLAVD